MAREACPDVMDDCWQRKPFSDSHHEKWPADHFVTPLEIAYRGLYIVQLCRCLHDLEHDEDPPEKPHPIQMAQEVAMKKFPADAHSRLAEVGRLLDGHALHLKNTNGR